MSLESRNYVATDADVAAIARQVLAAREASDGSRQSYLRALVATTQAELGATPRQRALPVRGKTPKPVRVEQLRALEAVDNRFYEIVKAAARERGAKPGKEMQRCTGFARSAVSTLRSWVRAGGDITSLVVAKVTKRSLVVETRRRRAPSARILSNRTRKYAQRFLETAETLAAADQATAREALEQAVERLNAALMRMGRPRVVRGGKSDGRQAAA